MTYKNQKEGRLTQCNRCGRIIFSERLKNGELDGGYTTYKQFENNLKGWKFHNSTGYLCPECEAAFKEYVEQNFLPYDLKQYESIEGFNDSKES